jgi:mRNA interferase RelE/StbE
MVFTFVFSEEFESQLKKLDNTTVKRILDKLDSTAGSPSHFFERLVGRDEYKIRIGDYRVIARILQNEKTIFVLSVGHRKNIYKK